MDADEEHLAAFDRKLEELFRIRKAEDSSKTRKGVYTI